MGWGARVVGGVALLLAIAGTVSMLMAASVAVHSPTGLIDIGWGVGLLSFSGILGVAALWLPDYYQAGPWARSPVYSSQGPQDPGYSPMSPRSPMRLETGRGATWRERETGYSFTEGRVIGGAGAEQRALAIDHEN